MDDDDMQFLNMVDYFTSERGDPERYCYWDRERAVRLCPEFVTAWDNLKEAEKALSLAVNVIRDKIESFDYPTHHGGIG